MADELLLNGSYMEALHAYCALLDLQPLHLDARLRVADALLALGEVQRAALVYTSLAKHSANAGYPLHAIMALKILSQLDPQFTALLKSVAELYANGSPRLGRGARMAPPDPEQEVPADLEVHLREVPPPDQLFRRAESVGSTFEGSGIQYPELLTPLPLFSLLPAKDFDAVLKAIKLLRVRPNTAVITEGEVGTSFFVLGRGSVRVIRKEKTGKQIQLAVLHPGSIFGEMALLNSEPRNATVAAVEDCDLLEFDRDALIAASNTVASIARALSSFTQERLLNNLMKTAALFKPLDDKQRMDLMRRFLAYDAEPGTALIREGEPGKGLFLVLRGKMEVTRTMEGQKQSVATLLPGDIFGEISLLNEEPTTASVVAVEKSTVLFLGRDYFRRLVEAVPEIRGYIEQLSEERQMDLRLSEVYSPVSDDEELDDDDIVILV